MDIARRVRFVSLVAFLFAFWLALSGHYTPVLVAAGAGSAILCAVAAERMNILDSEGHPIHLLRGAFTYIPWLLVEIAKSAWGVTKLILHPDLPISPTMTVVTASQRSAAAIATYANSITLTPGTITVGVTDRDSYRACPGPGGRARSGSGRDGPAREPVRGRCMMFATGVVAVLIAIAFAMIRAINGPTVFDRVLAGNAIGTLAILLLALVGFMTGRPEFLDIGLTYGLLNLVGSLAVLKFFRHGDLSYDGDVEGRL